MKNIQPLVIWNGESTLSDVSQKGFNSTVYNLHNKVNFHVKMCLLDKQTLNVFFLSVNYLLIFIITTITILSKISALN